MTLEEIKKKHDELFMLVLKLRQDYANIISPFKVGDKITDGNIVAVVDKIIFNSYRCDKPHLHIRKIRKNNMLYANVNDLWDIDWHRWSIYK